MPTVEHFEIPADDPERAIQFYRDVFNWSIESANLHHMDYWLIGTADSEGSKGLSGGLSKRQHQFHTNTNYIGVSSIDAYIDKIEKAGGKVLLGKQQIPGQGSFAICTDTENNSFGLWESEK